MGRLNDEDLARLRSVKQNTSGYKTSKQTHSVLRDADGSHAGVQTEHFDGRQDCEIRPGPVVATATANRPEG